jgi:hypothetical protein
MGLNLDKTSEMRGVTTPKLSVSRYLDLFGFFATPKSYYKLMESLRAGEEHQK